MVGDYGSGLSALSPQNSWRVWSFEEPELNIPNNYLIQTVLTLLHQDVTFLLQTAYNNDFPNLRFTEFFSSLSWLQKIRFSFRLTIFNFPNFIRKDMIGWLWHPDFRESDSLLTKDQTMIILKDISVINYKHGSYTSTNHKF